MYIFRLLDDFTRFVQFPLEFLHWYLEINLARNFKLMDNFNPKYDNHRGLSKKVVLYLKVTTCICMKTKAKVGFYKVDNIIATLIKLFQIPA